MGGWGEISTPIILLKDRLIGDKGGEEFLEEEKEGISFSSPEIPRGGNKEGGKFCWDGGGEERNFFFSIRGGKFCWGCGGEERNFFFLHQGGKVRIEEEIF